MKRILLSMAVLALTSAAFAQKKVADVAKFASETIDLGKIKQGTPTKGTFTVNNISGEPLIIEQANPTCGCTISDYTKEPIAAGKAGIINATYNAANAGHFEKHLTVKFAGVDEIKSITLTGDVLSQEEYAKLKGETIPVVAKPQTEAVKPQVEAAKKEAAPAASVAATKAGKTVAPKKTSTKKIKPVAATAVKATATAKP